MGKSLYTYYKERLIEIGGNNKCLFLRSASRKTSYDVGRILEARDDKVADFIDFLWSGRREPFTLICKEERGAILSNVETKEERANAEKEASALTDKKARDKALRDRENKVLDDEVAKLKELRREISEIEKETGRYELYLGYPFVFGTIGRGARQTVIKAPLLLFPVSIDIVDDRTAEISLLTSEKIHINHALIFAYAQAKKLDIDSLDLEFDDLSSFKNVRDVIDYLAAAKIKIELSQTKNIFDYGKFKEPSQRSELSVRFAAVLGRFPLSNSIYNDYSELEKRKLTNDAVAELLRTRGTDGKKSKKKEKKPRVRDKRAREAKDEFCYTVKMLDYAQAEVVRKVAGEGNTVIYGPPGTGKSQTIVNVITDALTKGRRVLVVSQKKAALDVVYNRLGTLNAKAMYLSDEHREKSYFYDRCLDAHERIRFSNPPDATSLENMYGELEYKLKEEKEKLYRIERLLTEKQEFGLSLSEMYSSSYMLPKNSSEYAIYLNLIENERIMRLRFGELSDALFGIESMATAKIYYDFVEEKEKNPVIDYMQPELDIRTLEEVKSELSDVQKSKKGLFNTAKHPYYRQVLAYFSQTENKRSLESIVKLQSTLDGGSLLSRGKRRRELLAEFHRTRAAISDFAKEYDCLLRVLTQDGYIAVIDNILRGNTSYVKLVHAALDNYIALRDTTALIESLDQKQLDILNFAYETSKNYANYVDIIKKLPVIRIYHELTVLEDRLSAELSSIMDYVNVTAKITKLEAAMLEVSAKLCAARCDLAYAKFYSEAKDNQDFLYQISKKQKYWPVRKTVAAYPDFMLTLFPCWLLSPENVSSILPLERNIFDVVIFDEASQIFIENTIPTIYRGKSIVVAGDSKQLRPSATFMKRYLGIDPEREEDLSLQAALEVDSLLDLAVARYGSANLTYHYRSRHSELIDFSNYAFYSARLQIAPNISENKESAPIVRYKVAGKWQGRKNEVEARKTVEVLKKIFATRGENESIGIITFNSEQQACIADAIERETLKNPEFRSNILKETHRIDNGEDNSLFIKNLENVQGDERDIIIFSIGYAQNDKGVVHASFGSLSAEGGENRLNVAITRAKSKIIVITSIEPEELKVDGTKNDGPKLLRQYLTYVRAVSEGKRDEAKIILENLNKSEKEAEHKITSVTAVEEQMRERLEKLGYTVRTRLGNKNNRISLAIYDEESDKYLVGVELDRDAFDASSSAMERDVYKPRFLESRGWTIVRVWCRDWWHSPAKVIKLITSTAERNRKKNK